MQIANTTSIVSIPNDVNAVYNWWGTNEKTSISQSIFDFEDDSTLGKVTFVPFLTEPNPKAPTFTPATTPKETLLFEEILVAVIVVAVIGIVVGLLLYIIKRK